MGMILSPVTVDVYVDPNIVAILPQYGPSRGGTQVNIYGKDFRPEALRVDLGMQLFQPFMCSRSI